MNCWVTNYTYITQVHMQCYILFLQTPNDPSLFKFDSESNQCSKPNMLSSKNKFKLETPVFIRLLHMIIYSEYRKSIMKMIDPDTFNPEAFPCMIQIETSSNCNVNRYRCSPTPSPFFKKWCHSPSAQLIVLHSRFCSMYR